MPKCVSIEKETRNLRYGKQHIKNGVPIHTYTQEMMRRARAHGSTSVYDQLTTIRAGIAGEYKPLVPLPTPQTSMSLYLEVIDNLYDD